MEHHLVPVFTGTIEAIPDNWGTKSHGPGVGCMNPELMGTAGKGSKLYTGSGLVCSKFPPCSNAYSAMNWIVYLEGTVVRVETKGQLDFAAGFFNETLDNSSIFFNNLSFFELTRQQSMSTGSYGEDHQAGCVHIQSVNGRLVYHSRKMAV
jgi:hypothetical protein